MVASQVDPRQAGSSRLSIPESPAPRGYLANPYRGVAEEAHQLLNQYLSPTTQWEDCHVEDGVEISVKPRKASDPSTNIPIFKGKVFIPDFRPIEVLACIHLFSYRLIWDTRMSSGRIMQRYGHYEFLFYIVYRGIGQIHSPRDAAGIQSIRFWGPGGVSQITAQPNTELVDLVYRSVETAEAPLQEDKVRMGISLGAYRIAWSEELHGCSVTFVGHADVKVPVPTYLWNIFSHELPKVVGRLRGSIEQFGVAPYTLDDQDCVVMQTSFYYSQTRRTVFRHHVRKPGTYALILDRTRMYPYGIKSPEATGQGAHAVRFQEKDGQVLVSVGPEGVGQEYVISIDPRDAESEPTSLSEWW